MKLNTTFLQTGTNLGDRLAHLKTAEQEIALHIGNIVAISKIYETEAWGNNDLPAFYNQVIEVKTALFPEEVLAKIVLIEQKMGRIREQKWGNRTIDIDILVYENLVIQSEKLTIPHPEMQNRNFVLIPLMELAPDLEHPILKKTVEELYFESTDTLEVQLLDD